MEGVQELQLEASRDTRNWALVVEVGGLATPLPSVCCALCDPIACPISSDIATIGSSDRHRIGISPGV